MGDAPSVLSVFSHDADEVAVRLAWKPRSTITRSITITSKGIDPTIAFVCQLHPSPVADGQSSVVHQN